MGAMPSFFQVSRLKCLKIFQVFLFSCKLFFTKQSVSEFSNDIMCEMSRWNRMNWIKKTCHYTSLQSTMSVLELLEKPAVPSEVLSRNLSPPFPVLHKQCIIRSILTKSKKLPAHITHITFSFHLSLPGLSETL